MSNNQLIKVNNSLVKAAIVKHQLVKKIMNELDIGLPELIPYRKGDKWGFCNRDKKILIECVYDEANRFCYDKAVVTIGGKKGCINKKGEVIIPFLYDSMDVFDVSCIVVRLNNKYGIVNNKGEVIADFVYSYISNFSEKFLKAQYENYFYGLIGKDGIVKLDCKYRYIAKLEGGTILISNYTYELAQEKEGLIDENGDVIVECIYDEVFDFCDGLARVSNNYKYGYINKKGERIIDCVYGMAEDFSNGLALVKPSTDGGRLRKRKFGFIKPDGTIAIDFIYEYATSFSEGKAIVKIEDKCGCINTNGKIVISCIYDSILPFQNGIAQVGKFVNGFYKEAYINEHGNLLTEFVYENKNWTNQSYFNNNIAKVWKNNKVGLLNKNGKEIVPCVYDAVGDFVGNIAEVIMDGKSGYIDKNGKIIIEIKYTANQASYGEYCTHSHNISEGCVVVEYNHKYGFFTNAGLMLTDCIFEWVEIFNMGLAVVRLNGKAGYIDKRGVQYWED